MHPKLRVGKDRMTVRAIHSNAVAQTFVEVREHIRTSWVFIDG